MKRLYQDWKSAHRTVRMLQATAGLRSVCKGIAIVDISLFLDKMGWGGGAIGGMMAVTLLVYMVLSIMARNMNNRLGTKRYLIVCELLTAAAALLLVLSANAVVIGVALAVSGLGIGHNGSGGPAGPIERAWMTVYAKQQADSAFGFHAAIGCVGLAIGCLLAGLPQLWQSVHAGAESYRPVFAIIALLSLLSAWLVHRVDGGGRKMRGAGGSKRAAGRPTNVAGLVNSLAMTLSGTMTAYWLRAKFGVTEAEIGLVLALSYAGAGISSLNGILAAKRFGIVKTVAGMQLAGAAAVALMPWAGSFLIAAALTVVSTSLLMGSRGNRNAAAANKRQRSASMVNAAQASQRSDNPERGSRNGRGTGGRRTLWLRLSIVLWPGIFGSLMEHGHGALPFYAAAIIQTAATIWYALAVSDNDAGVEV